MREKTFLKSAYLGSDGEDFIPDFIEYLGEIIENGKWIAMSDHQLYLDGGKQAIIEIIEEMKKSMPQKETK